MCRNFRNKHSLNREGGIYDVEMQEQDQKDHQISQEMFAFENVPLFQKTSAASSLKLNTLYLYLSNSCCLLLNTYVNIATINGMIYDIYDMI